MEPGHTAPSGEKTNEPAPPTGPSYTAVDVDLTALSSTMVYSEVYSMMTSPDVYIGKTVKMSGSFAVYHDEASDKYYFACIIKDATACCSQGIEFVLRGEYAYMDPNVFATAQCSNGWLAEVDTGRPDCAGRLNVSRHSLDKHIRADDLEPVEFDFIDALYCFTYRR